MQIILLSGGSGKRLWPLSNDVRSKQFLKLLTDENGKRQSMVQRVYAQIKATQPGVNITIATNKAQIDSIRSQLGNDVDVVIEPQRRDTFPAISLACTYLALSKKIDRNETIVVLPCDPFTETSFFSMVKRLEKLISNNMADMAFVGIKPLLPTSKYGYIVPDLEIVPNTYSVSRFVEKPSENEAELLIDEGAYWNGGVFAFKLGYLMDIVCAEVAFDCFEGLFDKYGDLEKISFDYKVAEKANRAVVVPYFGKWTDIGTWRTLSDEMPVKELGAVVTRQTRNTFVVNELNIPVIALGTKDVVIAASPDGILVSDLLESSQLKTVVDQLENVRPMYEERRWGDYTVLSRDADSLIKKLCLSAGGSRSYQSHTYRDEVWVVTRGEGEFTLDGNTRRVGAGDVLTIRRGQKHKVTALSDLNITEIQLGNRLDENDLE